MYDPLESGEAGKPPTTTSSTMTPTSDLFTTALRGGSNGTQFMDSAPSGDRSSSYLTKIIVSHNANCVHALKVFRRTFCDAMNLAMS